MKYKTVSSLLLLVLSNGVMVAAEPVHPSQHPHQAHVARSTLTEPGNAMFGTIQEVIARLKADPNTDWQRVDLEALRQHLLDMRDMTVNIEVVAQESVPDGLRVVVAPTTARANEALRRVFAAHPRQLRRETGWQMTVEDTKGQYVVTTTTDDPEDIEKIRGLGYIGLMAYGSHHQAHHWAIATGEDPHKTRHQ